MSAEWWSVIFAGGTFVVITATAIAALVQLRHMRYSNQISASLGLMERWATPEYRTMVNHVASGELDTKLKDPQYRQSLTRLPPDRIAHPEIALLDFWENIGSLVKSGVLSENALMDTASSLCITLWRKLTPVLAIMRRARGPQLYDNFEYLAARAMMWEAKHPDGTYPKGTPHLPVPDEYIEDTRAHVS